MKVFPIDSPLDGEQVVGVHPDLESFTDQDWRRRLNNFTGRTLTHTALRTEQEGRSGRISALGQLLSPGVINGLVADLSVEINGPERTDYLNISTGLGLDANGEVVTLNRPVQADIRQIPVFAPVTQLQSVLSGSESTASTSTDSATIMARTLGPGLSDIIDAEIDLPRAAILVLQPVQIEMKLREEKDPCELDPEQYAYENWQLVDGARLVLYSWPEEVISLPGQAGDNDWRNQIANSIFSYEQNLPAEEHLPWIGLGVALGVIGFDENWLPQFVDRNAAVRAGGKRRRSASLLANIGNRFLWQARFEQFNEQLVDVLQSITDNSDEAIMAASKFRYLPPVGVLPRNFIDLDSKQQNFFPLSYQVEAIAVPYEQLDVVVQDSASLATYDFNRADRIQALVPVPQEYYEPELLSNELIDPEFDQTINSFVTKRDDWLGRRLEIRRKSSITLKAMTGKAMEYLKPDPEAVDIAELAAPFETALIQFGDNWRYLKGITELPVEWTSLTFSDSDWSTGPGGFGFNSSSVETELEDMQGNYVSLYCRLAFNIESLDPEKNYRLEVLTNGGFIAYLNGAEVSRFNLSDSAFNTTADAGVELEVGTYVLGDLAETLNTGNNILALQAHMPDVFSDSFIFLPRLVEKQYVEQIESDDFGVFIQTNDSGEPVLLDAEPVYKINAIEELKIFFNSRTYLADEQTEKRIWATDDIEKFENIENDGLKGFIEYLNEKVNKANDKVDFGFIRLQTDIYRIRQFMLGNEQATKLATSPVLANIAKGETAVATKEEISEIATMLSMQTKATVDTAPDTPTGGGGGNVTRTLNTGVSGGDSFITEGMLRSTFPLPTDVIPVTGIEDNLSKDNIFLSRSSKDTIEEKNILNMDTTSGGELLGFKAITTKDIEEQSSIIGTYPIFRNVTVSERLSDPVSEDAVKSGRSTRVETIENILATDISMDGIDVPGFIVDGKETTLPFNQIDSKVLGELKTGAHDADTEDNEASRFNASVRSMENASALLRLTEGRIKTYKVMIDQCNITLDILNSSNQQMDKRLKQLEDGLAEARHDVSVSRALKSEEQERIDGINRRRKAVLEEHVPFLVYRRPRLSDVLLDTPVVTLNPDLSSVALPVCNIDEDETPEEISALIDEIREAPLKWFKFSEKLMKKINRPADLNVLLKSARSRATTRTTKHRLISTSYEGPNILAAGIQKSLQSFHKVIEQQRKQVAAIDIVRFSKFGWEESQKRATEVISLADVIDGNHGRMGASKMAAQELEQISTATVCLYLQFVQVLPTIRLDWAEKLSQYDAPFNLRNLYSLPRWSEIDYIERNMMQRQVDWLYSRINAVYSDASNMISDLVRIGILLASHAPVNKLITGMVPEPKNIKPGSILDVVADLSRVRIGMNLALVSGRNIVARGRVADIVGGRIKTEIVSTNAASVNIEKNTRVQIGEPRTTGGQPYRQDRFLFNR